MSYETPVINPDGSCCDCSQQKDCKCNSGNICSAGCRSRSSADGTASFCGFAEYIPSDPPVFYLTKTLSGGPGYTTWPDASCGADGDTNSGSGFQSWNGTVEIDKKTCVHTGQLTLNTNGFVIDVNDVSAAQIGLGYPINPTDVFTATTHEVQIDCSCLNDCCVNASGFGACNCPGGSGGLANLGGKEEASDAVARATQDRPWSPGGDCIEHASWATLTPPGKRFFLFQSGQCLATVSGLPGVAYHCTITLSSKAVGTDAPLTPFGLLEVDVVCPSTGPCQSNWVDMPLEQGLFITATGCKAVVSTG